MKVKNIAQFLREQDIFFDLIGNESEPIYGYSSLYRCKPGTVVWARDRETFLGCGNREHERFSLLITSYDNDETDNIAAKIMTDDPRAVFFRIVEHFWGEDDLPRISDRAIIKEGAKIGDNVTIGDGCVISAKTSIGSGTRLGCHVVTQGRVTIGENCVIQSGVVIGETGMALVKDDGYLQPIPHYGGVAIGDRVYIGANTSICRGTIEDTILHDDVKVDQLCQISHNCVIESGSVLLAGTVILGSVDVGKNTKINSALIKEQKDIGDNVVVSYGAVVTRKLPDNAMVRGVPPTIVVQE